MKSYDLDSAIAEIESCGFECEAGPLANSAAWRWLRTSILPASTKDLIDVRERALIAHDNAYPDVGPGIEFGGASRIIAVEQLIKEGKLPEGFKEVHS